MERKSDGSDRSCDYKTGAGATYSLEGEREGDVSEPASDYETIADTTYTLEVRVTHQIIVKTTKRG